MSRLQIDCPECGEKASVIMTGPLESITCDPCGWTQNATVFPGSEIPGIEAWAERARVRIEWKSGDDIAQQIVAARQACPPLEEIPLASLLYQAKSSPDFVLGVFQMPIAIEMTLRAEAAGVALVVDGASEEDRLAGD